MTDNVKTELNPCPFCGGEAEIECQEPDNKGGWVIGCRDCQASTRVFFGGKEELEEAWSQRAGASRKRVTDEECDAIATEYYKREGSGFEKLVNACRAVRELYGGKK